MYVLLLFILIRIYELTSLLLFLIALVADVVRIGPEIGRIIPDTNMKTSNMKGI